MAGALEAALSRRALLGLGFPRAHGAQLEEEPAGSRAAARPPAPPDRGEARADGLGSQLAPAAELMLRRAGLAPVTAARRVLVVAAGDGTPLAAAAARLGHRVTALEPDELLLDAGRRHVPAARWRAGRCADAPAESFDAVLAWFGATYEPSPRAAAQGLRRAVARAGLLVLVAWTPAATRALGTAGSARGGHRPEQWSRYETAYRHFSGFQDLDVGAASVDVRLGPEAGQVRLDFAIVNARAPRDCAGAVADSPHSCDIQV